MLLAFDIGNSGISFGVFSLRSQTPELLLKARIASNLHRTRDEYIILIRSILDLHRISADEINASAISSVVPELTSVIADAASYFSGTAPLLIGPGTKTGLNIRIDNQTQLGADIVANTVAAISRFSAPAVVADLGTATTLAIVDADHALTGAIICPGLQIARDSLARAASQLSGSDLRRPDSLVGKNTRDSVNSGLINGHILMLDGFIRELRHQLCAQYETKLTLVATGGLADYVIPYCRNKFTVIPALTLFGVAEIFQKNV